MKRLALTEDGDITYCQSSEENIGKGRCNHIAHQKPNESVEKFMEKCAILQKEIKENKNSNKDNVANKITNDDKIDEPIKESNLGLFNYISLDDLNDKDFSKEIGGSQPKTVNQDNQYIKFDSIEVDEFGKTDYPFSFPSITESVCSSLIRHSNIQKRIRYADYHLGICLEKDKSCNTLSISENYRRRFENEYRIASPYGVGQMPFTLMRTEDYRSDIFESISPQNSKNIIINTLIKNFGCDRKRIEKQFNDKCAIDILFNNKDIRNNPGNFVVVCDDSKRNEPDIICMDFGRCLHFGKTNTYR